MSELHHEIYLADTVCCKARQFGNATAYGAEAKDSVLMTYTIRPLFNRFSSTDKKLVLFPQYGHVLLGTKYIHKDVVQTVQSWLDNQVGRNGTGLITQKIEPSAPIDFPPNIQSNHAVLNQP